MDTHPEEDPTPDKPQFQYPRKRRDLVKHVRVLYYIPDLPMSTHHLCFTYEQLHLDIPLSSSQPVVGCLASISEYTKRRC